MQGKQAEAVLSDLVVKCEETGVALPADPWDALDAVLAAMKSVRKHEMGRMQVDEALTRLAGRFASAPTASGARKKRAAGRKAAAPVLAVVAAAGDESAVISPKAKRTKTLAGAAKPGRQETKAETKTETETETKTETKTEAKKKKSVPGKEQMRAEPAACKENQALVDQLGELGEFELQSGHTQRGTARLRAASQLRHTPFPITSGAQAKQLDHVGPSSAAKIDDILRGGLEDALREYSDEK